MRMDEYLVISTNNDLLRIASGNIMYITADGNYSSIMQSNGEGKYVVQQLGTIERMIGHQLRETGENFIRIGKSLIINKQYIYYINISKQQLVLSNGHSNQNQLSASKEALHQLKEIIDKSIV